MLEVLRRGPVRMAYRGPILIANSLVFILCAACGGAAGPTSSVSSQTPVRSSPTSAAPTFTRSVAPPSPQATPSMGSAATGELIAFIKGYDIYVIGRDGTGEMQLTNTSAIESGPAWSPDGTRLAYTIEGKSDIGLMTADGIVEGPIVTGLSGDASVPAWSPDGQRLAFNLYSETGSSIYIINADGTGLTEPLADGAYVDWSPDGGHLVYSRGTSDGETDLYVLAVDGSTQPTQITDEPGVDATARWSPDGSKIAFYSDRDDGGVYIVNPDGTDVEQILGNPLDARVAHLDWSSDGNHFAFIAEFAGEGNVASPLNVFEIGDDQPTPLTDDSVTGSAVSWRPAL